jgi:hypothetical protein
MTTPTIARIRMRVGELTRTSKPAIFIELILATGMCFVRIFPFSVQIFLVAFASLSFWLRGLNWSAVGLRKPKIWWKILLLAMLSAVAICALVNLVFGPVVERFAGNSPSSNRMDFSLTAEQSAFWCGSRLSGFGRYHWNHRDRTITWSFVPC